jgi:hypothetical protein
VVRRIEILDGNHFIDRLKFISHRRELFRFISVDDRSAITKSDALFHLFVGDQRFSFGFIRFTVRRRFSSTRRLDIRFVLLSNLASHRRLVVYGVDL